jgi:hypothetical protein
MSRGVLSSVPKYKWCFDRSLVTTHVWDNFIPCYLAILNFTIFQENDFTRVDRILRKFELQTRPAAWQTAKFPRTGVTTLSPWFAANLVPLCPHSPAAASAGEGPLLQGLGTLTVPEASSEMGIRRSTLDGGGWSQGRSVTAGATAQQKRGTARVPGLPNGVCSPTTAC